MRAFSLATAVLVLLMGCANMSVIRAKDVAGEPTVYCKVLKEPDPILLGGWKCGYTRNFAGTHEYDFNPVAYWLVKKDDRYALYFYRATRGGAKRFVGWRDWTINGNEIYSGTGIRIVARDGGVYYSWENQMPEPMTPFTLE